MPWDQQVSLQAVITTPRGGFTVRYLCIVIGVVNVSVVVLVSVLFMVYCNLPCRPSLQWGGRMTAHSGYGIPRPGSVHTTTREGITHCSMQQVRALAGVRLGGWGDGGGTGSLTVPCSERER
jgi:hypothetical protein